MGPAGEGGGDDMFSFGGCEFVGLFVSVWSVKVSEGKCKGVVTLYSKTKSLDNQ